MIIMAISEEEIERILATVQMTCAASGGCLVYMNRGKNLSVTMGEQEICYIDQEEGSDRDIIRQKIRNAVS